MSDHNSVISSLSEEEDHIVEMVANERMYYVLSQFLETEDNKNIAMVLADIVSELKELRKAVEALKQQQSSSSPSS